jgi:hypothetical protein
VETWTIDLDCAPGSLRPGDLLPGVLEGLNIKKDPEDTVVRFFGNWRWEFKTSKKKYERIKPIIKERITSLYNSSIIRYGSW